MVINGMKIVLVGQYYEAMACRPQGFPVLQLFLIAGEVEGDMVDRASPKNCFVRHLFWRSEVVKNVNITRQVPGSFSEIVAEGLFHKPQ
jgi:hypothetical protein